MPCTRSMLRSENKPSKSNARAAEEEMPPPVSETKTQRTRVKKASKKPTATEDVRVSDVSKSPSLSASSSKSTRTRTKPKTKPADKPKPQVESPPVVTRPTRSTRQNAASSKVAHEAKGSGKEISSSKTKNPVVMLTPMGGRIDTKASVLSSKPKSSDDIDNINFKKPSSKVKETAKKGKGRGRPKKTKDKDESEDTTTETESEMEVEVKQKEKTLTLEQIHQGFVTPLKMAMSLPVCEAYQRCMEKINDTDKQDKLNKQFEQLMNSTEMPPPLPPGPKAKGVKSKKRVRSPEPTTPSKMEVPRSFDFEATKDQKLANQPAMKRIMLDAGSSDLEGDSESTVDKNNAVLKKVEVVNNDKNLNQTFVCKTPKNDEQAKQSVNQNTTFTPELFPGDGDAFTAKAGSNDQIKQTKTKPSVSKEKVKTTSESNMDISENADIAIAKVINAYGVTSKATNSTDLTSNDRLVRNPSNNTASRSDPTQNLEKTESPSNSNSISSGGGVVSSLVNFFDNKKELFEQTKDIGGNKTFAVENKDDTPADSDEDNLNATYVLPPVKKLIKGPAAPASLMNVTVDMNKPVPESFKEKQVNAMKNLIMPVPALTTKSNSTEKFREPEILSRTFVKEPVVGGNLPLVAEEEEEYRMKKSDKPKPLKIGNEDNLKKKGISTSSSCSSTSSMTSASSHPCLASKTKATHLTKNAPNHGSASKLHDVAKSKALDDAQKRKEELLQLKKDNQKMKAEEWKKKVDKTKQEEDKKNREKFKLAQVISSSSSSVIKKPALILKPILESAPTSFQKPKINLGLGGVQHPNPVLPNLPPQLIHNNKGILKQPFSKPTPPPANFEMDESFKTASNSFLDGTMDGHLSSYDITVYEDLDDDMKYRQNKTLPHWASDKDALKEALYSMILLPDYQFKIASTFPKPDKHFKLFPNK